MRVINLDETLEKIAALEAASDLGKILSHKWHDHVSGGLADKRSPADFPREDLIKGMVVEMEHTSDPSVACEIAMDHLMEDPHYYNHEQDMAKEVQDKIGHVLVKAAGVDRSIELADEFGSFLALMEKDAFFNPAAALKGGLGRVGGFVKNVAGSGAPKLLPNAGKAVAGHAPGAVVGRGSAAATAVPAGTATRTAVDPTRGSMKATAVGGATHAGSSAPYVRPSNEALRVMDAEELKVHGFIHGKPQGWVGPTGQAQKVVGNVQHNPGANVMNNPNRPLAPVEQAVQRATGRTPVGRGYNPGNRQQPLTQTAPTISEKNLGPGAMAPTMLNAPSSQSVSMGSVVPRQAPVPYGNRTEHLLDHGTVAPAQAAAPAAAPQAAAAVAETPPGSLPMNLKGPEYGPPTDYPGQLSANKTPTNTKRVRKEYERQARRSGSSYGGRGGNQPTGGSGGGAQPPAGSPGSVGKNPDASSGPEVKRFGMGKALGYGALAGAGYGLYKGVPWAAEKMDENLSEPKLYGGGFRSTPYGYGPNPYGDGVSNMGAG